MNTDLSDYINFICAQTDKALDAALPSESEQPVTLHRAMRYSIFAGGKRMRPVLCTAAAEACGGTWQDAMPVCCALEMMHAYSLIHDDLPALDNDDLRRGKPTNHKVFGEAIAILAGDALLTEAFSVLATVKESPQYPTRIFLKEFAETGGSRKLVGGQVLDIEGEQKSLSLDELIRIHEGKTAALITAALRLGAMTADASPEQLDALTSFGYNLGLAFQVIDDILDITASTETLGKTAGKDITAQKSTYPAILGLEGARTEAARLTQASLDALSPFSAEAQTRLLQIADYLLNRSY